MLVPSGHGQQVDQITCTTVIPDEIFLDFSNSEVTNNNLAGVGRGTTDRWILGPDGTSDVSACPSGSSDGDDATAATSGCTPNPDKTLTVTNVLTDGSYDVINANLAGTRVITRAKMVLSIPPGGQHFANGETGNVIGQSESGVSTFASVNVDMFGQHSMTSPEGTNMGCWDYNSFKCRANFMLQFIDDTPGNVLDPPFKIQIPSMEFTWYDFDMNWGPFWRFPHEFTARECVYLYGWQRYATTGQFIDQNAWDYHTTEVLNNRYRFFIPYASEGCGTNMLPNYDEVGGVAVWKDNDPTQVCPIVDDDEASPDYTYQTGILYTGVTAGDPYCFPGNPHIRSQVEIDAVTFRKPPTSVRAYWKHESENWGAVGSCTAGTDIPAGNTRIDFNTAGYSVWTVPGDINRILVDGVETDVHMAHSFTIEYQASCRTHDYDDKKTQHGKPMCYDQPQHPYFTTNNDPNCGCPDKNTTTGRGTPVNLFEEITTVKVTDNQVCGTGACPLSTGSLSPRPTYSQLKACNTMGGDGTDNARETTGLLPTQRSKSISAWFELTDTIYFDYETEGVQNNNNGMAKGRNFQFSGKSAVIDVCESPNPPPSPHLPPCMCRAPDSSPPAARSRQSSAMRKACCCHTRKN